MMSNFYFSAYAETLTRLKTAARLRRLPESRAEGKHIDCDGRKLLNCSSNDYLGLAADKTAQTEAAQAAAGLPFTSSSSRLLTGNHPLAGELEADLAHAYQRPALLFSSGYHANVGLIPALFGKETLILADKLVHASIIDGIRLSAARHLRFRHNDLAHLRHLLEKYHVHYPQIAIITESIFSMDGDLADLPALVALKCEFPNILLYVDEAHAFGVYGDNGLGLAQETASLAKIDILTATFGKAAASHGAFAVLAPPLKEYLINTVRTLIFSTALPAAQLAVSRVMLHRVMTAHNQRIHLHQLGAQFRQLLTLPDGAPHIVPLILGEDAHAVECAQGLQQQGFYCLPIRPPTVATGTARIRFSLNAAMTQSDIESLTANIPK